ncbi:rhamnogalacturonan acetylesterase [Streptomyces sp. NBC_01433]|uniref:rhamnogalacturonan acetylesterase n=1 Tax=Streptomyces sp. NBC_01433 TaxID=2903864 RepID=UPI00224E1245|nr:rhamnogalacturonan acetylesterase [Streptomyces sp. NBC_01433]MCX4678336.1 rhamnogalacturonan acetylesterase [Streptomyces sp. NBC_01433]
MRRPAQALTAALSALAALGAQAAPAYAASSPGAPAHCTGTAPLVCHFDLAPGTYRVTALLGGATEGRTRVSAETRRTVLAETVTAAGRPEFRSFTVQVRDPEGEPTGRPGARGLDLTFSGAAPLLTGLRIAPASRTPQLLLIGDSTVSDRPAAPYAGWGQQLPHYFRAGISVANYADSGESSRTYLDHPRLFPAVRTLIGRGDTVLIQLAHNDRRTTEDDYRAHLTTMIDEIRARGGRPVLVTPVVRRRFNPDATLNHDTALLVNDLGVDLPARMRDLSATRDVPLIDLTTLTERRVEDLGPAASKALYLTEEKRDNTHTSLRGATEYATLVRDALRTQRLVPAHLFR